MAQRIYLAVVGGILLASGLFAYIDPYATGSWLGIAAVDSSGVTEIRSTYGGLVFGIGLLLVCGLKFRFLALAGLACMVFGMGPTVLTRLVAEVFFGGPGIATNQGIAIAFELFAVAPAAFLLWRALRQDPGPAGGEN